MYVVDHNVWILFESKWIIISIVQALLGIDFGRNEQEKKEIQTLYQIPITCNLAACMIATKVGRLKHC